MSHQLKRITFTTCNGKIYPQSTKRRRIIGSSQTKTIDINTDLSPQTCESVAPMKHLLNLLREHDVNKSVVKGSSAADFFVKLTEHDFSSYQDDVLTALRQRDIEKLKDIKEEGRSLQCCNRFGESLIHMACRRGFEDIVSYLLEAGVSLRVKDDVGRTPMHDAFWTAEPNFEMVKMMIFKEPQLLFISDNRGHTPLDYARRNDWLQWNGFLNDTCQRICNELKFSKFDLTDVHNNYR